MSVLDELSACCQSAKDCWQDLPCYTTGFSSASMPLHRHSSGVGSSWLPWQTGWYGGTAASCMPEQTPAAVGCQGHATSWAGTDPLHILDELVHCNNHIMSAAKEPIKGC